MNYKDEFIRIYERNINREGADKLLHFLKASDFFTAPASTRFHEAYEGGLVEHSVKVYNQLEHMCETDLLDFSPETIAIVALLHDLCKVNFYSVEYRNRKNDKGQWEKYPFYIVDDQMPLGHGEKSIMLIRDCMDLSLEEMLAIRWHMNGFEPKENYSALGKAYNQCPLAVYLAVADLKATYL